jgi:ERF superfamily
MTTATDKLETALAVALAKLEGAKKKSANPHFKSKYADLGSVIDAIRPIAEHGIWFRQSTHPDDNGVTVETFYIGHGASISAGILHMPADKRNPQGFGSALTYARRYALQTAFGLASEDDDGNAASTGEVARQAPAKRAPAWSTPITGKSALHKALMRLERELAGCGDSDMVYALTSTQEWRDFVTTAEQHAPHYLRGGDPAPPEFEGLLNTAERMVAEFDRATANNMVDLASA